MFGRGISYMEVGRKVTVIVMEHNFLTEASENFLKHAVRAKSTTDKYYTDGNFFKKVQEQKLKEATAVYFNFKQDFSGKKLAKQHCETYDYKNFLEENVIDKNTNNPIYQENTKFADHDLSAFKWVHLIFPEVVDVDYSEYSDEKFYKNNLFVKEYKDGLMAVAPEIKDSVNNRLHLSAAESDLSFKMLFAIEEERFYDFGSIDWENKKFDNLNLYIVAPKINKNKAVKIVLKNNIAWNKIVKQQRKNKINNVSNSELVFLRKNSGCMGTLGRLKFATGFERINNQYQGDSYKNLLLKTSFQKTLFSNYHSLLKTKFTHFNKIIADNGYSYNDLKEIYLKEIYPYEQDLGPHYIPLEENQKMDEIFYKKKMIKSILLNKFCSFNTLPNGITINIKHNTPEDCVLFWTNIDLFELFFNLFNEHNNKLSFYFTGILNDETIEKYHGEEDRSSSCLQIKPIYESIKKGCEDDKDFTIYEKHKNTIKEKFDFKDKHILQEAMDAQNGFLMPYDGAFELLDDPIYKFIRFREYENFISIVISDKNERCLVEVFDKNKLDFKYMIWNDMKIEFENSKQCVSDIYTKLAVCIRDAKILIERDSTMRFQGKRTPHGCNTNSSYEIYFPRSRSKRNNSKEQLKKEKDFFNESRKFSGTRRQHARKLIEGYKADKRQLLLAKQMDFYVPDGHTYVKASTWGDNMTKREIRYRNTALNGIFYFNEREMSEAEKITRMSSAGFEEYCSKRIEKLGYEIKHKSNYDGGIDIRAVRVLDNMQVEDLLVQCKHWNSPIPPGAIRDFKTACDIEETNNLKKFMFITSSTFSSGAKELAEKFNIMLTDVNDLI